MHINSDTTFGHSRIQNNEAKESKGYPHTLSKKERDENSKDGVRMVEIREDYHSSRVYEISGSYYFDNRRQTFLTVSHQQLGLAVNKKALS
jgi:hypothetical protein